MKTDGNETEKTIIEKAKGLGASLAGIGTLEDLKASPLLCGLRQKAVLRRIQER